MQDNFLRGPIPKTLGALSNLEILLLNDNGLTGLVPEELFQLGDSLTDLDIGSNLLNGTLSRNWGNLTNLTSLHIYNNSFSGVFPDEIFDMRKLRKCAFREMSYTLMDIFV